ncbi:MAG: hypothetical protein FDZ75_06185 [Actinobacteria bacterium]|nr:MAG: hypothetical protein FDZ75_06185 [Actinomycetota bacterium]
MTGTFVWRMPGAAAAAASARASGQPVDVQQIRGSMSFAEIATYTGIPAVAFEKKYGIAPADMSVPIKDIAEKYGFDVHTGVRGFAQEQLDAGAAVPAGAPAGED